MRRDRIDGKAILFSDPHGFHGNIQKYSDRTQFMTADDLEVYRLYKTTGQRGGRISDESIHKMNEFILDNINAEIEDPEHDTVVCNGDFVFGNSKNQYRRNAEYFRDRINCRDVRIVWGNHDDPDAIHDLFTFNYDIASIDIGRQRVVFSHYPMVAWEGSHRGVIHCHGHVHGLYIKPTHPHPLARPNLWAAIDIGVDTNGLKPYTMPQVIEKMKPIWKAQEEARREGNEHHMF